MAQQLTTIRTDFRLDSIPTTVEPTERWVRVKLGDTMIADSRRALLLCQYGPDRLPTYYVPQADVGMEALVGPARPRPSAEFEYRSVRVGDRSAEHAAWIYAAPPPELDALR